MANLNEPVAPVSPAPVSPVEPVAPTTPAVVDMNTLNSDQLNRIRENIRMEERVKLQSQLDTHASAQEQLLVLTQENTAMKQSIQTLTDDAAKAVSALQSLQASVDAENKVDTAKLIRECNEDAEKRHAARFSNDISEMRNTITTMQQQNATLALENYKQKRVAEERAKGTKFIVQMVTGSTEAEIERSLQDSIDVYRENFPANPVVATPAPAVPTPVAQGPSPVTTPAEPSGQAHVQPSGVRPDAGISDIVGRLANPKTNKGLYTENREALLEAASAEFEHSSRL